MCDACYIFTDDFIVADIYLEKKIEAWSCKWDLQLNLTKYQRLASGREHRGNEKDGTAEVSKARPLGVTITSNFKPPK